MSLSLTADKTALLQQLQRDILPLQGLKSHPGRNALITGLEPISAAFPHSVFPTGAVHEFCSDRPENSAATWGFLGGIMGALMRPAGALLWIGQGRSLFPPALKMFGVKPENIIFIDLPSEKKALWAMEEALKCPGIAGVVCEVSDFSFTDSRRLQLATEQSGVTGFILRGAGRKLSTNACVSRWRIRPLPGEIIDDLPGVGFPRWQVELLKIRNGRPGAWTIGWSPAGFRFEDANAPAFEVIKRRKAG